MQSVSLSCDILGFQSLILVLQWNKDWDYNGILIMVVVIILVLVAWMANCGRNKAIVGIDSSLTIWGFPFI